MRVKNKKEWDFIIKETHEGDKSNHIKREILSVLQGELSKPSPNLGFYNEMKKHYLNLDTELCTQINTFIKEHESEIFEYA